jgi:hypothetical protein
MEMVYIALHFCGHREGMQNFSSSISISAFSISIHFALILSIGVMTRWIWMLDMELVNAEYKVTNIIHDVRYNTIFSSSLGHISIIASVRTSASGLLCNLNYSIQHSFNSPVPLIKRQRSLTEAVLISFGSTTRFPMTLKRRQANASQRQIICCTVSASFLQNLQVGSPSNRPMVRRCFLTGARAVRIATTILS